MCLVTKKLQANMLPHISIFCILALFAPSNGNFFAGRTPPGKFEYPDLNGLLTPDEAKAKCDSDEACGGFTFKGSFANHNHPVLVYFFHVILVNCVDIQTHSYWSTYQVDRNYVKLEHDANLSDLTLAIKKDTKKGAKFPNENFIDVPEVTPSREVVIRLDKIPRIKCGLPKIDRCCKLRENQEIKFDGVDDFERASCDMSKAEFYDKFTRLRKPVLLLGCQKGWKSNDWTLENVLNRYDNSLLWTLSFSLKGNGSNNQSDKSRNSTQRLISTYMTKDEIFKLLDSGTKVKIFEKLCNGECPFIDEDTEEWKQKRCGLLEDYEVPKPMGNDLIHSFHVETNQAYVILASKDTGLCYCLLFFTLFDH